MKIITPRLILREVEERDSGAFLEIIGDRQARQYEQSLDAVVSAEEIRDRIARIQADRQAEPRTRYRFAITIPPGDEMRGWVSVQLNYAEIREWEMGWSLARAEWGRGYATEAARALLRYAFTALDAHRVIAFCHAGNDPSVRVMERLGMQRDARLRQTRWINRAWADEFVYAILEEEFWAQAAVCGEPQQIGMPGWFPETRAELVERIRFARKNLEALLATLDPAALERPGPDGGWSVKDHLAHLTGWTRCQLDLIDGQSWPAALGVDADLFAQGGIDALNAVLQRRSRGLPLAEVLAEFRAAHEAILARIARLDEADLARVIQFPDPAARPTLLEAIGSNTFEHDEEHAPWIRTAGGG